MIPERITYLAQLLTHPGRVAFRHSDTAEEIDAFIDSRALEYATRIEDEFVQRALSLGVEAGMVLDIGTRAGLIALKILWHKEDFYAIGMDASASMIERAQETATAWGLGDRAFFQVGDARQMRFKGGYFDLVVSDSTLHRFDSSLSVLAEIRRVIKPKGALLIRDLRRPNRLQMKARIRQNALRLGKRMEPQIETALRAAYTRSELDAMLQASGMERARIVEPDTDHILIERRGETDPNSWIKAREQYL